MATLSVTDKYEQILEQIKNEYVSTIKNVKKFVNSAPTRVKELCEALASLEQDGTKMSYQEIRNKVYEDCSHYWERDTIRKAFPDWIKEKEEPGADTTNSNDMYGIILPEEKKKYCFEELKDLTLNMKRQFGQLIKDAETADEVQNLFNDWCYTNTALKNIEDRIENMGKQYKLQLVDPETLKVKQLRKPISVYNLNFVMNNDIKGYLDRASANILLYIKQMHVILNAINSYPIVTIEEARKLEMTSKTLVIDAYLAANMKSSQSIDGMIETEELTKKGLTEKQAGKRSEAFSLVCKKCVKKFDAEHNDDPPIMQVDTASPTGYRCVTCLGIEMVKRGLTKDIVFQRREFLYKFMQHRERYPASDFFKCFGNSIKAKLTAMKKVLMSELLENSSFGSTNSTFEKLQ